MNNLFNKLLPYEAILFDLDNTIYDQEVYDFRSFYHFFSQFYIPSQAKLVAQQLILYKRAKPYAYPHLFDDFFERYSIDLPLQKLIENYKNPPINILKDVASLKPILLSLIPKPLYLITNGYTQTQTIKIKSLEIESYFKKIIILDPKKDIALKPSADILSFLDINPSSSVYIGDNTDIDAKFAQNCQMSFIHFVFKG